MLAFCCSVVLLCKTMRGLYRVMTLVSKLRPSPLAHRQFLYPSSLLGLSLWLQLSRTSHSPWGRRACSVREVLLYQMKAAVYPMDQHQALCIPGFSRKILNKSIILTAVLSSFICSEKYYFVLVVKSECLVLCFISEYSMSCCYI